MQEDNFNITLDQIEKFISEEYLIRGIATELPGEIDLNFRIKKSESESFIFKIFNPTEALSRTDFQQKILYHISQNAPEDAVFPKVIPNKENKQFVTLADTQGNIRNVLLISWIPGRLWSSVNPKLEDLYVSLGEKAGVLTDALQGFSHQMAEIDFDWDIAESLWTKEFLHLFSEEEKEILFYFQKQFEASEGSYKNLRKSVVHNDVNDHNILVTEDKIHPKVNAIIDFGDACQTQIINDVAIACAYAIMDKNDPLQAAIPLIKGYHSKFPLLEEELEYLYNAIAMRLVISVTKSARNKIDAPENKYLLISEKPAWELLKKWEKISASFALYCFRHACGFTPHPNEIKFKKWSAKNKFTFLEIFPLVEKKGVELLDLSVSSKWIGHQEEFNDLDLFEFKIKKLQKAHPNKIIAGGYAEPRPIYTSEFFDSIGNSGRESRTIHLGIDFWLPEETPIHALFDGEIVTAVNQLGDKQYGGLLILKHEVEDFTFFTLYGHLSIASVTDKKIGTKVKKGEKIGGIGNRRENGNWVPHLHFQVLLSRLDEELDFPGVAFHHQIDIWKSICPDPNLLFKNENLVTPKSVSNQQILSFRKKHLGKSLSLQYKVPLKIIRGLGAFLLDENGKKYLDTVNNVAHVGHEHYAVVKAGQEQMALLNTNTRYLNENINELAKELLETLPPELEVMHFVNSGSEANELAIRMVHAATGEKDIIASEVGYHGNSNMCIAISSYKFDGKGGQGAPENTHIFPLPDAFRGKYKGKNAGEDYASEVHNQINNIHKKNRKVGGFILEPIISCGGQIELPEGFLPKAYELVRAAGGLCISDEVQTGCGRMGKTFWGFQLHDVVPDIVTIGKPLGNGHPIGAVACTKEVAEKFANGMEYFNTFGGNPVSCAIGTEVIKTVKREKLQENASNVGEFLKEELKKLSKEFPIIRDVRGQGLFLGVELVDAQMNPLAEQTDYIANRMKDHGILMSTDGPDHNVLKIKPPIIFTKQNAEELILYLQKIFAEDFMKIF
jgi:4-aminobutyrate aminotransferase-like enzyme/Ser/Thr protein kinase RdoA (MazF antagonist)